MLLNVQIKWYETFGWSKTEEYIKKFDAFLERWDEFCSAWPLAPKEKPTNRDTYELGEGPCRLDSDEAQTLVNLGIKIEIVPLPDAMVAKQYNRTSKYWGYGEKPTVQDMIEGHAVQITIPDFALLMINEVTYREDACTDAIQGLLDEGWRILAVCPPNAQRRPDYILGRKK